MSIPALEIAKEEVTLVTRVSTSAGAYVSVPTDEWFRLMRAINAVVAEDKENRR